MNRFASSVPSRSWPGWIIAAAAFTLIGLVLARSLITLRLSDKVDHHWVTGDWVIDYSGGFVRRGLLGEIARVSAQSFGLGRTDLIFWTQSTLFIVSVVLGLILFLRVRNIPAMWPLILSPAVFLFPLDVGGAYRKEVLLFATIALFLALSLPRSPLRRFSPTVLYLGLPLAVLSHEGLFFFLPLAGLGLWILSEELRYGLRQRIVAQLTMVVPSAIAFALSVFFRGSEQVAEAICSNALQTGVSEEICGRGALGALPGSPASSLIRTMDLISHSQYLGTYSLSLFLASLAFVGIMLNRGSLVWVFVGLLFTLPLFLVATDWGRWIHIFATLLTMIVFRFVGSGSIDVREFRLPRGIRLLPFAVGLFLFVTSWNIPHHGGNGVRGGLIETGLTFLVSYLN